MLYADQKLEPPSSTKANPHPEKLECPPLRLPLYNVVYKTAKKRSCLNFTELTLLLGSDEALWCVGLPSFVICFFAIIPSTVLRLREINTNLDLTDQIYVSTVQSKAC